MVKYIYDEFRGDPVKTFALGLKTSGRYKGVYEWKHVEEGANNDNTPKFTNWAAAEPTGEDCIAMDIGEAASINGRWKGVACGTLQVYGICEKVSIA